MTTAEEPNPKDLWAECRLDLVRRLFAVAISIGIGSAIINARWVKEGEMPNQSEWEQIAIVALALFATVLSWDAYLISVHKKKLYDKLRFTIDVVLVFTYLFLFATSNHSHFWLPIICWMYTLYVLWDALSVVHFPQLYDTGYQPNAKSILSFVGNVYWDGLRDNPTVDRPAHALDHNALRSSGTSPNFLINLASPKTPVAGSPVRLNATAPT